MKLFKNCILTMTTIMILPYPATAKEPAKKATSDTVRVLKISPQDERAVVQLPGGKMEIVKVGDALGNNAKITEISDGRVVIEETKGHEIETIIICLEDGKQKAQRLKKSGGPKPALLAPSAQGGKSNGK